MFLSSQKRCENVSFPAFLRCFLLGCLLFPAIAFFLMPFITRIIFPGFDLEATKQTVLLSRILLAQPILLSLSGFFGSINQTALRFVAFAASPILYNLGIIGGILFLVPKLGLMGLAIGVVVGAFFHFWQRCHSLWQRVILRVSQKESILD